MKTECNENKLLHQRELNPRTVGDFC